MHLAITVTAILFAFTYPIQANKYSKELNENAGTCHHSIPVESFAASFFTALVTTQDPDVVQSIQLPGMDAADLLYPIVDKIMKDKGLCDADLVAWTASRAVAMEKTLKLTKYYKRTAFSVAELLEYKGLLNCKTAVPLAIDFFLFARKNLAGLDDSKFESYMQGIVQGMVDFYVAHGLELEDVAQLWAEIFYRDFNVKHHNQCKLDKAQN